MTISLVSPSPALQERRRGVVMEKLRSLHPNYKLLLNDAATNYNRISAGHFV